MTPSNYVLMPTYRNLSLVTRSVTRIIEHSSHDLELVIVNNDPSQSVQAWVAQLHDSGVTVIEMGHNAGFSQAINAGISASSGELVFFANADLFVSAS